MVTGGGVKSLHFTPFKMILPTKKGGFKTTRPQGQKEVRDEQGGGVEIVNLKKQRCLEQTKRQCGREDHVRRVGTEVSHRSSFVVHTSSRNSNQRFPSAADCSPLTKVYRKELHPRNKDPSKVVFLKGFHQAQKERLPQTDHRSLQAKQALSDPTVSHGNSCKHLQQFGSHALGLHGGHQGCLPKCSHKLALPQVLRLQNRKQNLCGSSFHSDSPQHLGPSPG